LIDVKTFSTSGPNGYTICEITSDAKPIGALSANTVVEAGTGFLIASIFDPGTGACPDPAKVQFTVTGPDGTVYNTASNTPGLFVRLGAAGTTYALCAAQPAAGRWSMTVRCSQTAVYRADLIGLPSGDPIASALGAAGPYYPNVDAATGHQYLTDIFGWAFRCLGVVLASAAATSGLQLAPLPLIVAASGLTADAAQRVWTCAAQGPNGAGVSLTQQCKYAYPDSVVYTLRNGDGEAKLDGWTIIANGGQGWSIQQGYATSIQYDANFAVSTGWCKKSQTIDLVKQAGFTAEYLDQAPDIQVLDWIAADYPTSTTDSSQYYLTVQLQDASHTPVKIFQTGNLLIPSTVDSHGFEWQQIGCNFSDYGAGIRYIYFEHGGLDKQQYAPQYGLKITGAEADVVIAMPADQPRELIQNGSGSGGLSGWDVIGSTPWTVETGPGRYCPGTTGTTVFAVTSGTGTKSQLIDLLAAGYTADALDTAPVVRAAQWICAESGCVCTYTLKFELRDATQRVIASFDSGPFSLPESPAEVAPFRYLAQNLSDYGPGLRYIYFEHSAAPAMTGMSAQIAGASIRLQISSAPTQAALALPEDYESLTETSAADPPVPIDNTTVVPYRWVCRLGMGANNMITGWCTGWLIPKPNANLFVVGSAAHCFKSGDRDWPTQVTVMPAAGNQGGSPYTPVTVPIGRVRVPYNWLAKNQGSVDTSTLYDYAAICVPAPTDWDAGGFTPTVEDDATLRNQPGTITGFPAAPPYTGGKMYTEPLTLSARNSTQVAIPTNFTPGSSGGPVYVRNTSNIVGIVSYGYAFPLNYLFSNSATRIDSDLAADITRWSAPLQPTDRVTRLQMVIRTGLDTGAGTDDDLVCTIKGQSYDLEDLWKDGASFFRSRNENGDYDGYDLTSRLNEIYPSGIQISDLIGQTYSIKRNPSNIPHHSMINGDWEVESVAIFVNDQLLCAQNFNKWVLFYWFGGGSTAVVGTFTLN
jgi:V8-like Glu-specific endopeptidase